MMRVIPIPLWELCLAIREAAVPFGVDPDGLTRPQYTPSGVAARLAAWTILHDAGHGPTAIARAFNVSDPRLVRRALSGHARVDKQVRTRVLSPNGTPNRAIGAALRATRESVKRLRMRAGEVAA